MVKVKDRNSNFEVMRIISMIFIILWHIIIHGNMISNCDNEAIKLILQFLQYTIIIHVNSFVILSGYFQSKSNFKLSKFLALFLQVIFYSVLIFFVIKLNIIKGYGVLNFVENLLPSSIGDYWFIKMYVVVYLLSDIINKFIYSLDKKTYKNLLILLFVIFSISSYLTGGKLFENNGYNFYNFIFLYMIGGYFARYPLKENYHFKNMTINGYRCFFIFGFFLMAILNFLISSKAFEINSYGGIFTIISQRLTYSNLSYSTPFVMIQTICYFAFFETLNIKSKFINFLSSCTFGIYLFNDHPIIRSIIYKALLVDNGKFNDYNIFVIVLFSIISIFIIGVIIECIRKFIIWVLLKLKPTQLFISKFKNLINSFSFDIKW